MRYFAYGSNMSLSCLRARVPSAQRIGSFTLIEHDLRFHKISKDGSGKCDAFYTGNPDNYVQGVLWEIDPGEKGALDRAEGLGYGYDEKNVKVLNGSGEGLDATTYYAIKIDNALKPYCWYKNHVLVGAQESSLPESYIQEIEAVECVEDPDEQRDAEQRAIHK